MTESLESEIQKAFDNIKLAVSSSSYMPPISSSSSTIIPQQQNNVQEKSNQINIEPIKSSVTTFSTVDNDSKKDPIVSVQNITAKANPIVISQTVTKSSSQSSSKTNQPPPPPVPRHRNIDSDEVRVMQKVLSNEVNDENV